MTVLESRATSVLTRLLAVCFLVAFALAAKVAFAAPASPKPAPASPTPAASGSAAPAAASAPTAPDRELEQKKQQAKDHFIKGLEFVQNENWDAALAEFLASRDLFPTRVALENAGICLRELKRYSEALDMYNELLAKFGKSLAPSKLSMVQRAVAQLEGDVGRITVTSDQAGSNVVVDGRQRGTTPLAKPIVVNAGTHTVRVYREGFETFEKQVLVAGRQSKTVSAHLVALRAVGTLAVKEATGQKLDAVVDGVVVGKTPWSGSVSVGTHTVLLRGNDELGTPPSSAVVKQGSSAELTLRAAKLDASIRVEPTPSNAEVDIDGVSVGHGIWEGRLASGQHRLEIGADGFVPYRKDVTLRVGPRDVLRVSLDRDLTNPMWKAGFVPHVYAEIVGGATWAPSFGGGADRSCTSASSCSETPPLGFLAGARGGYEVTKGLGLELFLGAIYAKETTTRQLVAAGEYGSWTSSEADDTTEIFGPAAALSASYRFLDKTPLTFRMWVGVARVKATFTNGGRFAGTAHDAGGNNVQASAEVSVPEQDPHLWVPFGGPEVRIGYRFTKHLSVDLGAALLLMFPPDTPRTGTTGLGGNGDRWIAPSATANGQSVQSGLVRLPHENGFSTTFLLTPTFAGRYDF
jgi:PEGA domain